MLGAGFCKGLHPFFEFYITSMIYRIQNERDMDGSVANVGVELGSSGSLRLPEEPRIA